MMNRSRWGIAALVLTFGLLRLSAADDSSPNQSVDKLAEALAKDGATGKKQAGELASKIEIDDLMGVLGKRAKDGGGGFGFGPKPTGERSDSIERKIESLAKTPLDKDALGKEAADLEKLSQRTAAVAAVTAEKMPPKVVAGKDAKLWKQFAASMAKESQELSKAVKDKDKDPKAAQAAAVRLDGACKDCHAVWR